MSCDTSHDRHEQRDGDVVITYVTRLFRLIREPRVHSPVASQVIDER